MTAKEYEEGMINLHFIATKYGYDRYAYRGRNYDYEAAKAEQWKDDLIPVPSGYQSFFYSIKRYNYGCNEDGSCISEKV